MRSPETVGLAELRELLTRCWMTHDAMWFSHCFAECGIETTNRINRAAVRSMARIEVRRLMKLLEVEKVETFRDLEVFLAAAFELVRGDFMTFRPSFRAPNTCRWDMPECFAYEGIKKMGAISGYQCGIFDRVEGWFEGLGVRFTVTPKVEGCMMHTEGTCHRTFELGFQ